MTMTKDVKQDVIRGYQRKATDSGSPEVQIALLPIGDPLAQERGQVGLGTRGVGCNCKCEDQRYKRGLHGVHPRRDHT